MFYPSLDSTDHSTSSSPSISRRPTSQVSSVNNKHITTDDSIIVLSTVPNKQHSETFSFKQSSSKCPVLEQTQWNRLFGSLRGSPLTSSSPHDVGLVGHHCHAAASGSARNRTVLSDQQLHTLRTCYAANARPDTSTKLRLSEMTSLSPRVIRVWFQNKRCKDKKKTAPILS